VRHTTSSAFKAVKIGQIAKSRRYSNEPHDLSARWAMRRPWRVFARVFVAHGRKRSLNRNVLRSRPATVLVHQCGNCELTNKQKNWYRIRVFGDDRHRGDLPRGETCIGKDIRRSYWFYAKVGMAGDGGTATQYICDDRHSILPGSVLYSHWTVVRWRRCHDVLPPIT